MSKSKIFEVFREVEGTEISEFIGIVHGTDQESVRRLVEKRRSGSLTVIEKPEPRPSEGDKIYFLFGGDACRAMYEGGFKAFRKGYKNDEFDYCLFVWEQGKSQPHELLEAFTGYEDWQIIDKKIYNKITSKNF